MLKELIKIANPMNLKNTIIATAIMLLTTISLPYLTDSDDQPLKKDLTEFPMVIGDWHGTTSRFDQRIYDVLGVDNSLLANYHNEKNVNIQLYIGYYKSQREGEIIHSPKHCMPGSGWNIVENSLLAIDLKDPNGQLIKVIKLNLQNGAERQVAMYWFHSRGRVINSEYMQKIYLVWDAITKHRTDGSFVRLISSTTDQGERQTTQYLKQFSELIFPILDEFIPTR
jgi:EpsI family protein